jgi:large-conductance mechanosensitive channel
MNLFSSQTYIDNGDFSDFLVENNILPAMASVSIALVSSDFIKSFVSDIVFPLIVLLLGLTNVKIFQIPLTNNTKFNFIKFFQSFTTLIIIILTTYYLISYFSRLVIKKKEKERNKK